MERWSHAPVGQASRELPDRHPAGRFAKMADDRRSFGIRFNDRTDTAIRRSRAARSSAHRRSGRSDSSRCQCARRLTAADRPSSIPIASDSAVQTAPSSDPQGTPDKAPPRTHAPAIRRFVDSPVPDAAACRVRAVVRATRRRHSRDRRARPASPSPASAGSAANIGADASTTSAVATTVLSRFCMKSALATTAAVTRKLSERFKIRPA